MKRDKRGNLIVFSGPSGVGKGTIRNIIFEKKEELNLVFSVSATSREKRKNEVEGVDYFFISKEKFKKWIDENKFLEWTKYVENYYGTLKNYVDENLKNGKNVFLEIEIEGVKNISKIYSDAIKIFLIPPNFEELKERLIKRSTEDFDNLEMRLKRAKEEIEQKNLFDHILVSGNQESEKLSNEVIKIIKGKIKKND